MRKSAERHPLAVLRGIINKTQPQFAKDVGISQSTVAKIESLQIPISMEHAILIESETGCSAAWLKAGDVNAPPRAGIIMPDQQEEWEKSEVKEEPPFTLETYQWVRSRKKAGLPVEKSSYEGPDFSVALSIQTILLACHKANRRGNKDYARIKLHNLATQFARELGESELTDEGAPEFATGLLEAVHFFVTVGSRKG